MMLPGVKRVLAILFLLATLRACLLIAQTWFLSLAIVGLWEGGRVGEQVISIVLFFISFFGVQLLASVQDKILSTYAAEQSEQLRQDLLSRVFGYGPTITQASGTGSITTTVLDGIAHIEIYLKLILPKLTGLAVIPIILLIAVFILDWISGLVLLVTVPLILIFMIILGKAAQSKAARQYKVFQQLSNHFIDSLRGLDTLKLFGISRQYSDNVFRVSEQFRKATMETLRVVNLSSFSLDFFSTLSIAIVAVLLGIRLLDGSLLLLPALASLILSPEYFRPIREFAADYHASLDGKNALEAVQRIIKDNPLQNKEVFVPKWHDESRLLVEDLDFAYEETPVLQELSFTAKGYSKIGIIGMSGSGKTSLINILSGYSLPDKANIHIDDYALSDFKQHDWQNQILYLPQEPYIFHATLRENIVFYQPKAGEEEINEAIAVAGLEELIRELPEGIETKIGEGARSLSGGQAQRVALARSFFSKERKVLLFDEPTAHLDIETELELKMRMLPLMEDRLVFFATHRLHWMKEMDYILVIDQGRIVETGTWQELLEQKGLFSSFLNQSKAVELWQD